VESLSLPIDEPNSEALCFSFDSPGQEKPHPHPVCQSPASPSLSDIDWRRSALIHEKNTVCTSCTTSTGGAIWSSATRPRGRPESGCDPILFKKSDNFPAQNSIGSPQSVTGDARFLLWIDGLFRRCEGPHLRAPASSRLRFFPRRVV